MDPLAGRLVEQLRDDPEAPEVVGLEGEDADVIFDALSSETTRAVLSQCYDGGRTRSELADDLDTSIQNVSYHVEKLEGAGLIEPAEIRYGENGQEVRVYEPSKEAVLIAAGETGLVDRLKHTVGRLLSPILLLGLFSAAIAVLIRGTQQLSFGLAGSGADAESTEDAAPGGAEDGDTATTDSQDGGGGGDGAGEDEQFTTQDNDVNETMDDTDAANETGDVVTDSATDAAAESTEFLLTEPWVFAGISLFLLGLVVVVTADRFGAFDRGPERERTGYDALLLGTYTATSWRYLAGAVGLSLGTFLLLDVSLVDPSEPITLLASLGVQALLVAGAVVGSYHAYRNRGVVITGVLVGAPFIGVWAYLIAPWLGASLVEGTLIALAALGAVLLLAALPATAVAYLLGRGVRRWRSDEPVLDR